MSLDTPDPQQIDGSGLRIAIIAACYNKAFVDALVREARKTIEASGAPSPAIERVPGSAELPCAAALLGSDGAFDAIIALGVVIAGDTEHHKVIGSSTAAALQTLGIREKLPVINGILVVENTEQAKARAGKEINRGREFALAALEMARLKQKWTTKKQN
ncbi:MAG: 6,7-dimethyl-8-ribityllumazine synthase [Opitutales bacterium]